MIRHTFDIEIVSPCLCAGADQNKAEIRAASIRGHLRWWFRTLGGFLSFGATGARAQEDLIFGSAAGEDGQAGLLLLRVSASDLISRKKDGQSLGHPNFSDSAFLTFPIQSREKDGKKITDAGRGVIESGTFKLTLVWKGAAAQWQNLQALIAVFVNLGSLGFRSRRAMGALASPPGKSFMSLGEALSKFRTPEGILIKRLPASSSKNAISTLGAWLRSARSHGRSGQNTKEQASPFFDYARNDHDIGYQLREAQNLPAYRPAIGLPIIQRTSRGTNNWEWNWNAFKRRAEGRFASPVILRPHRDASGSWNALIIFVDSHKWPEGKKVYFNGAARSVSLDLYDAMKNDEALKPFPA